MEAQAISTINGTRLNLLHICALNFSSSSIVSLPVLTILANVTVQKLNLSILDGIRMDEFEN